MPKVSIVIPIYNVEKYIKKCIDSVIDQTLKDIEIICVDDGSTDSCPEILDEYAEKDSRVRVIHKENGGYGKAMNVGFDAAEGEYIGIVESDDFILPDMYETLYNTAVKNDLDAVKSDFFYYWDIAGLSFREHKKNNDHIYNRVLRGTEKKNLMLLIPSNWTGVYKREFLMNNGIRHNETPGASYQDTGFWFQVMALAESVMLIDKSFYMYRQDNMGSSMKSKQKMLSVVNECEWIRKTLGSKGADDEWSRYCFAYQLRNHFYTFKRIDDSLKPDFLEIVKEDYIENADKAEKPLDILYNTEYEWLEKAAANPEAVYDEYIAEKDKIFEIISSAEEFVIYGAGIRAAKLCFGLDNNGYYDKINCFAVTNRSSDTFCGKPVKSIDEITNKESLIIIAVKKNTTAYCEIKEKLDTLNFNNVYDVEMLSNYF